MLLVLVPTMIWVRLRTPWAKGVVEFLCLLPLTIPALVIVFTPALEGMREQWREAAENLGATRWQYFRLIAGPVLLPPFLASTLLLFANAFSAYATAYALTTGIIPLVPIQIGSLVSGNVVADQQNLSKALGLGMIVVVAIVMAFYAYMQRRASRWLG